MKKYLIISAICLSFSIDIFAQTSKHDPIDVLGWYGTSCTKNLPKKWEAYVSYQARYYNNLKTYNGSYITIGGSKKLNKYLELMGDYRLALVNKGTYNRFTIGAEASKKVNKFNYAFRLEIQNQLQDFIDTSKSNDNSGYWRTRFAGKYSINKKAEVYASVEPVMKFGGNYFIDNIKNTVGFKYKIFTQLKLDLYYIYRPDYAKSYNRLYHIIGLNADYTIKKSKKKHKK